jgi:hypothetical protein
MEKGSSSKFTRGPKIILRHYTWLKSYWTPNKQSYSQFGENYIGFEWKKTFEEVDAEHPKFAQFFANAMKVFAKDELS